MKDLLEPLFLQGFAFGYGFGLLITAVLIIWAAPINTNARRTLMTVQSAVLNLYSNARRGLTADEAAASLGESILTVRPAVTRLRNAGKLIPTGERRENLSGRPATVLVRRERKEGFHV